MFEQTLAILDASLHQAEQLAHFNNLVNERIRTQDNAFYDPKELTQFITKDQSRIREHGIDIHLSQIYALVFRLCVRERINLAKVMGIGIALYDGWEGMTLTVGLLDSQQRYWLVHDYEAEVMDEAMINLHIRLAQLSVDSLQQLKQQQRDHAHE